MSYAQPSTPLKQVRDAKSGRIVSVRGAGALKGRLKIQASVDLTKPIASQAMKRPRIGKRKAATTKP